MRLSTRLIQRLLVAVVATLTASACGDVIRGGRSPVIVVIDSLRGATGGATGANTFTDTLHSDVITNVTNPPPCTNTDPCATIFSDSGEVVLHLAPKDIA